MSRPVLPVAPNGASRFQMPSSEECPFRVHALKVGTLQARPSEDRLLDVLFGEIGSALRLCRFKTVHGSTLG